MSDKAELDLEASIQRLLSMEERLLTLSRGENALPLPVQSFPVNDNTEWEPQKQEVSQLASNVFAGYEADFLEILETASDDVSASTTQFFAAVARASKLTGVARQEAVHKALAKLLPCSPKKILAGFQTSALQTGWAYVSIYNSVIDHLAEMYPRCRVGIYASRLKYSDVVQLGDEIMSTLRSCSVLLEDLERRYDTLEGLQHDVLTDLEHRECDQVWEAVFESVKEKWNTEDDSSFLKTAMNKATAIGGSATSAAIGASLVPVTEFQGHLSRVRRVHVFFEMVKLFRKGWEEWRAASKQIIRPNLFIMFSLKRDFFRNQILSICDLLTFNGYTLEELPASFRIRADGSLSLKSKRRKQMDRKATSSRSAKRSVKKKAGKASKATRKATRTVAKKKRN